MLAWYVMTIRKPPPRHVQGTHQGNGAVSDEISRSSPRKFELEHVERPTPSVEVVAVVSTKDITALITRSEDNRYLHICT